MCGDRQRDRRRPVARGEWLGLGGRLDPWSGMPDAVYLPPGTSVSFQGDAQLALCWAPAPGGGAPARLLPGGEIEVEIRGHGPLERRIQPILMADRAAESLLVVEVLTPAGHWSSYPPHRHDRDDPPAETLLEETYYHRSRRSAGSGSSASTPTTARSTNRWRSATAIACSCPVATTRSPRRRATTSTTST